MSIEIKETNSYNLLLKLAIASFKIVQILLILLLHRVRFFLMFFLLKTQDKIKNQKIPITLQNLQYVFGIEF